MTKRLRDDSFERLFTIANTFKAADDANLRFFKKLKHHVLAADEDEKVIRKAAKEFRLEEAVQAFALTYKKSEGWWKIEDLPDVKNFQPSACLMSHLKNYVDIYDRSSEAACRIGVDFLLCECIATMRGKVSGISPTQLTADGRCTPVPWDNVNVHCEVSFTHTINPLPTISEKRNKKRNKKRNVQVGGRVDHGVGIVTGAQNVPNRRFLSLLLCIEAKFQGGFYNASTQLVVYLACLRQSRINRGRSNTSVYGVATDGLSYIFVTITHEGVLKESNAFNVNQGGLSTVLGSLRYILEMAMSVSPNLKEETQTDELEEADADDVIDLDDIPFLHPDDEENEVWANTN